MNEIRNYLHSQTSEKTHSLERLLKLGAHGHFPLFYPSWISASFRATPIQNEVRSLTNATKIVKDVYSHLSRHRTLERQRTVLLSLSEKERNRFIHSFIQMVESHLLDCDLDQYH